MQQDKPQIDENALSRQLATYGAEAQAKLMKMRVFIHGITGLGIEVAKNLILAGPKQVTLYDEHIVNHSDIGRNFYCNQNQIGKLTRSQACLQQLKNLNPSCNVNTTRDPSIEHISQNYDCVVVLDFYQREYLIQLNKTCHNKNIGFILGGNLGLYGYAFVDFGEQHKVFDTNGEEPRSSFIAGISQEENGLVYLHVGKRHGLNDGDFVEFKQVKGMTQVNGKRFKIQVKTPGCFSIGDTRAFSSYQNGGIFTEIKLPILMEFHDLEKSLSYPYPPDSKQMPIASWQKFGVPEQLHLILNGIYTFYAKNNRVPAVLNNQQAEQLVKIVNSHRSNKMQAQGQEFKVQNIDQNLIRNVALYAQTQISPVCSFWGGIITQEIVKFTGKYTPLRQWLHHQFFEILPSENVQKTLDPSIRYIDYVTLFGDEFLQKCKSSNSFMIGAGALGCQFVKMFALMGLATQGKGKLIVSDDDNIQISNLNRQFLFRRQHVGHNKSETACSVGKKMNTTAKFEALKLRISPQNEDYFNDKFWTELDFVVNAVDNVNARKYVDQQCVWHQKPLFESGTLGTKCHSQIIIPHHTLSYTDIIDPPEQSFATCTLKLFPYQIQHTIQWARQNFDSQFSQPSLQFEKFCTDDSKYLAEVYDSLKKNNSLVSGVLKKLTKVKQLYQINQNRSYADCVQLAIDNFQFSFNYQIAQLLDLLPENHIDSQTKMRYWSGLKRAPQIIHFSVHDPLHLQLIQAGANIYATILNIPVQEDKQKVAQIAQKANLHSSDFKKIKIQTEQDKGNQQKHTQQINPDQLAQCFRIIQQLSQISTAKGKIPVSMPFEKDDPNNWHIEFMGGVANLRARNYRIEQVDNFKIKLIAGKIIPAIATTTAMVVGTVGIEIIKLLLNKPASNFKNVTINLALPLWVFNDPMPPIVNQDKIFDTTMNGPIKVLPGKYTKWDKINIKGPMTVVQLKDHLEARYKFQVSMISYGTAAIYSSYGADSKKRLSMLVEQAVVNLTKKQLPTWKIFLPLGVTGNLQNGTDCLLPDIKYQIA